jgi:hypothetical protein
MVSLFFPFMVRQAQSERLEVVQRFLNRKLWELYMAASARWGREAWDSWGRGLWGTLALKVIGLTDQDATFRHGKCVAWGWFTAS